MTYSVDVETHFNLAALDKLKDHFKSAGTTNPVILTLDSLAMSTNTNYSNVATVSAGTHVHGPDCNHSNDHLSEGDAAKFVAEEFGPIDVIRSFATSSGPLWAKNPAKMLEMIHAAHQKCPKDKFTGLFLNSNAYTWLLSSTQFQRMFMPSEKKDLITSGIIGTIGQRIVLLTDAFLEPEHQVTMPGAFYFVELVKVPPVEEQVEAQTEEQPAAEGCGNCANCECNQNTPTE